LGGRPTQRGAPSSKCDARRNTAPSRACQIAHPAGAHAVERRSALHWPTTHHLRRRRRPTPGRRSGERRTPRTLLSSNEDREGPPVTPSETGRGVERRRRRRRNRHQGAAPLRCRMLSRLHQVDGQSLRQGCRQFALPPGVVDGVADDVVAPTVTVPTPPLRHCGGDNYDPRMRPSPKEVLS